MRAYESAGANLSQIARDEASSTKIPRPALRFPEGNSILNSREQNRATSLDNLPRINQRGEVEADNVHLEFDYILILNHGADDSILDFAVMQIDADFVADFELALWFPGWHSTNKREAATWQPPFLL